MTESHSFDVIIVGGSYAGLSAAMTLGRSLRKTLIIDGGEPCNRQTPHSHNFVTHDGATPAEIANQARTQVLQYENVRFLNDFATKGEKLDAGFAIETKSGQRFYARKLVLATGIKDTLPDIKGLADCWGISVIHCPYCHGYEFRGEKTGIIANGNTALHLAALVGNLTDSVSVFTNGKADFSEEQMEKLRRHNISVSETPVAEIEHDNGQVKNLVLSNGEKFSFKAVYAAVPFVLPSVIPVLLGCELTEQGRIRIDASHKTTVEGVFACGDNSSVLRSVANAVSAGNLVGAMVNREITEEDF